MKSLHAALIWNMYTNKDSFLVELSECASLISCPFNRLLPDTAVMVQLV